jgi:hypothetical protein
MPDWPRQSWHQAALDLSANMHRLPLSPADVGDSQAQPGMAPADARDQLAKVAFPKTKSVKTCANL